MGQTWEKELSQSGMSAEYIEVRFTIRNKTKKCIHCKIVTVKYNLFSSIFHNRIHWFWDQSDLTTQKDPFIRLRVRAHLRRKFKTQKCRMTLTWVSLFDYRIYLPIWCFALFSIQLYLPTTYFVIMYEVFFHLMECLVWIRLLCCCWKEEWHSFVLYGCSKIQAQRTGHCFQQNYQ